MRISFAFSVGLVVTGVFVTLWCLNFAPGFNDIIKIGPAIISSGVAALPMKAFLAYRSRVATYIFLLGCCSSPDPLIQQVIAEAMKALLKLEG